MDGFHFKYTQRQKTPNSRIKAEIQMTEISEEYVTMIGYVKSNGIVTVSPDRVYSV